MLTSGVLLRGQERTSRRFMDWGIGTLCVGSWQESVRFPQLYPSHSEAALLWQATERNVNDRDKAVVGDQRQDCG
jgi:hypothetical protein